MSGITSYRFNDEFGFLTFLSGSNPTPPDQTLQSVTSKRSSSTSTPHPPPPDKSNTGINKRKLALTKENWRELLRE